MRAARTIVRRDIRPLNMHAEQPVAHFAPLTARLIDGAERVREDCVAVGRDRGEIAGDAVAIEAEADLHDVARRQRGRRSGLSPFG